MNKKSFYSSLILLLSISSCAFLSFSIPLLAISLHFTSFVKHHIAIRMKCIDCYSIIPVSLCIFDCIFSLFSLPWTSSFWNEVIDILNYFLFHHCVYADRWHNHISNRRNPFPFSMLLQWVFFFVLSSNNNNKLNELKTIHIPKYRHRYTPL